MNSTPIDPPKEPGKTGTEGVTEPAPGSKPQSHSATDRVAGAAHEAIDRAAERGASAEERIRATGEQAAERARRARQQAGERYQRARGEANARADALYYQVDAYVRENPMASLGMAVAAGFLIGKLLQR